jgi:C_GCAxxG_C_C family probable redox protein
VEYFAEGGLYCSEAILRAFNEVHDLGLPTAAYAMATPFGAGMGAAKCSCGAVTGGQMVLGLARGRISADESEGPAFDAAKQLHDRFRARYKVICCRGLTRRLPWGEPEHHLACQEYVRFAANEVAELLQAQPAGADSESEQPG